MPHPDRGPSYWIGFDLLLRIHLRNKKKAYRRGMLRLDLDPPEMNPAAPWHRRWRDWAYYACANILDK